jgi:hypothetical protein
VLQLTLALLDIGDQSLQIVPGHALSPSAS